METEGAIELVGRAVGVNVGREVGLFVGKDVGPSDTVGREVGGMVGRSVGVGVAMVGATVGLAVVS